MTQNTKGIILTVVASTIGFCLISVSIIMLIVDGIMPF